MTKLVSLIILINTIFFGVECKPHNDRYKGIYRDTTPRYDPFGDSNEDKNKPSPACQDPSDSAYSKEDLIKMVSFFVNQHNIVENINEGFFNYAQTMINQHNLDLDLFKDMVEHRPEHMTHIISSIKDQSKLIGRSLKKHNRKLIEVDYLETKFNEAIGNTNLVLSNLERYKNICANNYCGQSVFEGQQFEFDLQFERQLQYEKDDKLDDYYCDHIDHIKYVIENQLYEFQNEIINQLYYKINADNEHYQECIVELKKELKEAAIAEYGSTMYDFLTLLDGYIHFEEDLIKVPVPLHNVKRLLNKLEGDVENLSEDLQRFKDYCLHCDEDDYIIMLSTAKNQVTPVNYQNFYPDTNYYKDNSNGNLLEQVIQYEYESLLKMFLELYKSQAQELDKKLDTFIEDVLENMVPLQNELDKVLKTEMDKFMELKRQFPYDSYAKLRFMYASLKESITKIELAQEFLGHTLSPQEDDYKYHDDYKYAPDTSEDDVAESKELEEVESYERDGPPPLYSGYYGEDKDYDSEADPEFLSGNTSQEDGKPVEMERDEGEGLGEMKSDESDDNPSSNPDDDKDATNTNEEGDSDSDYIEWEEDVQNGQHEDDSCDWVLVDICGGFWDWIFKFFE